MGSLVSGIFDLLSGDPTKKEEGELGDLSTYETNLGEKGTNLASDYYGGILSGDPATIARTLAPEISAGAQSAEQQKKTMAEFGQRSGGTTGAASAIDSGERANIINLIGGSQQHAADAEAGLGTNLLSQSSGNINSEADLAARNQQRKTADVGGIAQGAAEIASGFIPAGGMGVDPYQVLYNAQHAAPVATEDSSLTDLIST